MRTRALLAAILATGGRRCDAKATASWLPKDFTQWFWVNGIVTEKWIYLDGGEIHGINSTSDVALTNTLAISLTTPWTTDNISAVSSSKPSNMPFVRSPVLGYDNSANSVFAFGGWAYDDTVANPGLWSFQATDDGKAQWTEIASDSAGAVPFTPTWGSSIASDPTNFYSLGGVQMSQQSSQYLNELQNLTFANWAWTHAASTANYSENGSAAHGRGSFVADFGPQGILVFIGGMTASGSAWTADDPLRNMSDVIVYDIQSKRFFVQEAGGVTPVGRKQFCMAGNSEAKSGTYELYIYGGSSNSTDGNLDTELATVYILTLPAFTWLQAVPGPKTSAMRDSLDCHVIGGPQLLMIGGSISGGATFATAQDPWPNGLNIFNMETLEWSSIFDPNAAAYTQPDIVKYYYGNQSSRFPKTWTSVDLGTIIDPSGSSAPSNTPPTNPSPNSPTNSKPIGAIVGGVIGGLAILALGFCIYWFRLRKRSASRHDALSTQQRPEVDDTPMHKEVEGTPQRWEMEASRTPQELHAQPQELDAHEPFLSH